MGNPRSAVCAADLGLSTQMMNVQHVGAFLKCLRHLSKSQLRMQMKPRIKKVTITIETNKDTFSLYLSWRELSTLVGALNIMNDIANCNQVLLVAQPMWIEAYEKHTKAFESVIGSPQDLENLCIRLSDFSKDRGLA